MSRAVHPIERESFRILRELVDLSHLPPLSRAVTERVIHASADPSYASDLVLDEEALRSGRRALVAGAPVIVDARMVAAGITARQTACILDHASGAEPTRAAAGVRVLARASAAANAVWVIGSAPTALFALLKEGIRPPLVIGLPVGFVGAVESKVALAGSGLACVTNRSPKGGSAVAAAALNALLYLEES